MAEFRDDISQISIEQEMKNSYMDYAMSVIASRALPDVRDGLKPVHRRILFAQHELSNEWNRAYKKSARVVGDVMGKYHPHGDSAIYDALVRMAQDFSMRLPLEDGQGNFGSMDGDNPAAMRYTEVRMSRAASFMLRDIEKDTVDFRPNYDGHNMEPSVLPARFPNLLANGTNGIAVGMATNIPPHNLGEVIDATMHLVDNPESSAESLLEFIKGPDFPTGGIIMGTAGIQTAATMGRGSVIVRARTDIETDKSSGRQSIIVTEIPYQVNKAKLVERIAELVREKLVEGISEIRDESDKDGVRVVVDLRRDAHAEVVLSQLLKHSSLQTSFSYNMLALDGGRPRLMGMKDVLTCFIKHREEVITRRTMFERNKARARAHILVGLAIAVANIDDIIKIVRHAPNPAVAKEQLMTDVWSADTILPLIELLGEAVESKSSYKLTDTQAQAILDLRLHRLTGLEREKINAEASDIAAIIKELTNILANRDVLLTLLKEELQESRDMFATERKTDIEEGSADVDMEDLIKPEEMVVMISTDGYVKRQPLADYRAQRRGGRGKNAANMKDEEQIQDFFIANTHSPLLFFTTVGKVYKLKVYNLPLGSSNARGKAFVNLLPLEKDERVMRVVKVPRDNAEWENMCIMFATSGGIIRKTPMTAFNNVYVNGIKGITLNDGDILVDVKTSPMEEGSVLISTANGQAVRFEIGGLRAIASRTAVGVKGITLKDKDKVVSMDVVQAEATPYILTITENGFGKRTAVEDFPVKGRGTMGVIAIKTTDRNGKVVSSLPVADGDHVMAATSGGQVIRMRVDDISTIGRNTQGVTLFKAEGKVGSISRIPAEALQTDGMEEDFEEGEAISEVSENASEEMIAEAASAAQVASETAEENTEETEA